MRTLKVTNQNGRSFNINLVFEGEKYGREDALTNDYRATLVEFYDAKYEDDKRFPKLGQFCSRYNADTLMDGAPSHLNLHGGIPEWTVDTPAMERVRSFVLLFAKLPF